MKSRLPTANEVRELIAFLPRLSAEGWTPVRRWMGGVQDEDGVWTLPWPEYDPVVEDFVRVARAEYWLDYEYRPEEAHRLLETEGPVETASLAEIKMMLTYFVRGERFSDGHWAEMIERGHVRRLLERLSALLEGGGV